MKKRITSVSRAPRYSPVNEYSIPLIDILPLDDTKLDAVKTNLVIDAMISLSVFPQTFVGTERLSLGTVDTLKLYEGEMRDRRAQIKTDFLFLVLKTCQTIRAEGDEDCRAVFECLQQGPTHCKALAAVGDLSQLEPGLWSLTVEELGQKNPIWKKIFEFFVSDLSSAIVSCEQVKLLFEANLINR